MVGVDTRLSGILFDDIGSYPLPPELRREDVQKIFDDPQEHHATISTIINDAMRQKINAGVEVPTYPQFQDMYLQFLHPIVNPEYNEDNSPFILKKEHAKVLELDFMDQIAKQYYDANGKPLQIRVCITGPLELYARHMGNVVYDDVLQSFAESVRRFTESSLIDTRTMQTRTISLDEPSIGINPELWPDEESFIKALDTAGEPAFRRGVDVQIHLHSPAQYSTPCKTRYVNVVGVESGAHPEYLDVIDKKDFEANDKFIRVGVARTDILRMGAEISDKLGKDVWRDEDLLAEQLLLMESPELIEKRLSNAYHEFGELIRYVGPDCGLGSWPSQRVAYCLLESTAKGLDAFKSKMKK